MCRRLLCYGDSNTYGYDPCSYLGGRYSESVRWTAMLRGYGWEVINRGENGRSIPRGDGEINVAIQSLCCEETDIPTVMLGSNDLLQMPSPSAEECARRMERFLTALLHADGWEKSRKLLLIAPPPMALGTWVQDEETIAAWRNAMAAPRGGWVSVLQMRAAGVLASHLTGCIFLRRAIWLLRKGSIGRCRNLFQGDSIEAT